MPALHHNWPVVVYGIRRTHNPGSITMRLGLQGSNRDNCKRSALAESGLLASKIQDTTCSRESGRKKKIGKGSAAPEGWTRLRGIKDRKADRFCPPGLCVVQQPLAR